MEASRSQAAAGFRGSRARHTSADRVTTVCGQRLARRCIWRRRLGLRGDESDPVLIVQAAQIRLRRWRRLPPALSKLASQRVRQIIEARDRLMRESMDAEGSSRGVTRARIRAALARPAVHPRVV